MPAIAVIGAQYGDEGKGKIVDWIASKYPVYGVIRFNGGAGAGHEVIIKGRSFIFHQIPSAAFLGKKLYIGSGCAVDPEKLFQEIRLLKKFKLRINLAVDEAAKVTFDFLREIDAAEENFRKAKGKIIGTTVRGIGPTYMFDVGRLGLRIYDIINSENLKSKLSNFVRLCQAYLCSLGSNIKINFEKCFKKYSKLGKKISPYVGCVRDEINKLYEKGKLLLFEGAQGTLLDQMHGIYPNVTSSRTTVDGVYGGSGLNPGKTIGERLGVVKAYTTKVGRSGPFVTAMEEKLQNAIRERGWEFGRTTGRPRAIGWLNLPELKYSNERNSFTGLAVTRVDVLGGIDPIFVCTKLLDTKGRETTKIPSNMLAYEKYKPIYTKLKGWPNLDKKEWLKIAKKGFESLPKEVKEYVKFIENYVGVPVKIISVGAEREATIEKIPLLKSYSRT